MSASKTVSWYQSPYFQTSLLKYPYEIKFEFILKIRVHFIQFLSVELMHTSYLKTSRSPSMVLTPAYLLPPLEEVLSTRHFLFVSLFLPVIYLHQQVMFYLLKGESRLVRPKLLLWSLNPKPPKDCLPEPRPPLTWVRWNTRTRLFWLPISHYFYFLTL